MRALRMYAGPKARQWIERHGLSPQDVHTIPAAAGGPKGLMLGRLDRFLFCDWLSGARQPIDLVGASIGAWRMATACLQDARAGFKRLEHDYIRQHVALPPGRRRPDPAAVSAMFGDNLTRFYGAKVPQVIAHPRFRLHVLVGRGRHVLSRSRGPGMPLGYLGAFLSNCVARRAMGAWMERVVFSTGHGPLPFGTSDYRTLVLALGEHNFQHAVQASCSIPFVLQAVRDIPGAPRGAYWDGGITDYHLHLDYAGAPAAREGIVLYPHFQRRVVPGWLDKGLKWRHGASRFLDPMLVLAPDPQWVRQLPDGKLPDRSDFVRYGNDLPARVKAWSMAVAASQQLADELAEWLRRPDPSRLEPL